MHQIKALRSPLVRVRHLVPLWLTQTHAHYVYLVWEFVRVRRCILAMRSLSYSLLKTIVFSVVCAFPRALKMLSQYRHVCCLIVRKEIKNGYFMRKSLFVVFLVAHPSQHTRPLAIF